MADGGRVFILTIIEMARNYCEKSSTLSLSATQLLMAEVCSLQMFICIVSVSFCPVDRIPVVVETTTAVVDYIPVRKQGKTFGQD